MVELIEKFTPFLVVAGVGGMAVSFCLPSLRRAEHAAQPQWLLALGLLALTGLLSTLTTGAVAGVVGARFSFWLEHTREILTLVAGYLLALACAWDLGVLGWQVFVLRGSRQLWRERGFFSLGPWGLLMVLLAAYFVLITSNITLISLTLLQSTTAWHDATLWNLEGRFLVWLTGLPIDVALWDGIYHSCWGVELLAVFLLLVLSRRPNVAIHFCVSFVLIYFVGRFLGLMFPVKGPVFHQTAFYTYLSGSVSQQVMSWIHGTMNTPPSQLQPSAMFLGGVSALPSLHVGMVCLTTWWLYVSARRTLWLTAPWVLVVWASTVLLGWHYAVDGLAGLALAAVLAAITRRAIRRLAPALALEAPGSPARAPG